MEPFSLTLLIVIIVAIVVVIWISGPKDKEKEKNTLEGILMCVAGLGLLVLFVRRRTQDEDLSPALFLAGIFFSILLVLAGAYVITSTWVDDFKITIPKTTQSIVATALAVVPAALAVVPHVNWGRFDSTEEVRVKEVMAFTKSIILENQSRLKGKSVSNKTFFTEPKDKQGLVEYPWKMDEYPLFDEMDELHVQLILQLQGVFVDFTLGAFDDSYQIAAASKMQENKHFGPVSTPTFSYFTGTDLYLWCFPVFGVIDTNTENYTYGITEEYLIKIPDVVSEQNLKEYRDVKDDETKLGNWLTNKYKTLQSKEYIVIHNVFNKAFQLLNRGKIIGSFSTEPIWQISRTSGNSFFLNYKRKTFVPLSYILREILSLPRGAQLPWYQWTQVSEISTPISKKQTDTGSEPGVVGAGLAETAGAEYQPGAVGDEDQSGVVAVADDTEPVLGETTDQPALVEVGEEEKEI